MRLQCSELSVRDVKRYTVEKKSEGQTPLRGSEEKDSIAYF